MGLAISKMWTCNIQFALIFNQLLILHSVSWRNVQLKKKSTNLQIKATHFNSKNRIGHLGAPKGFVGQPLVTFHACVRLFTERASL